MGTLRFIYTKNSNGLPCFSSENFDQFNASQLGLGDISKEGEYFEALAAIFDLEAFTSFCNQIDPHLVVPEFLNEFLQWLFTNISQEFTQKKTDQQIALWCELPFYAKFLGDGVLFLWDTRKVHYVTLGSIVVSLRSTCETYKKDFLPKIRKRVSKPPTKLRCGIARGQIISVGDGNGFVDPCINLAARLQKLGQFSFAFSKRGFDLEKCFHSGYHDAFVLIKSQIRGVGDEELLYVNKDEFNSLSRRERRLLQP